MAIVFEDHSKCPLCNKILNNAEEYILFPPFIGNKKDPLFIFSDNGVHVKCLNEHPLGKHALLYLEKYDANIQSVKSGISTSGEVISNPANIIAFGLLTSDATEDLFKFNYFILNKANISEWKQRDEFIRIAARFNQEGKWEGITEFNYLDYLINLLNI